MTTIRNGKLSAEDIKWIESTAAKMAAKMKQDPDFIVIDLFCGAGGTTIGIEQAEVDGRKVGVVIAAVNHDWKAIKSHWTNHKHVVHFEEDIRSLPLGGLKILVDIYRKMWPNAKVILWASLECTHFSKAKGGQAREADSRTLGRSLYMKWNNKTRRYRKGNSYIQVIKPDYIHIENVEEFLSWGPLDKNGKPIKEKRGMHFRSWCNAIKDLGYHMDWKKINAADHGGYTKRIRLFGCFAKGDLPIIWPEASHSKNGDMFTDKWLPVKEVLDFEDEGVSIFPAIGGRKKYMSIRTYKRILAGCHKFIAPGGSNAAFLLKYNSTNQKTGIYVPPSVDEPAPTISTQGRIGIITPKGFLANYYGDGGGQTTSLDDAAPTMLTKDTSALIQPIWVDRQYGEGGGKLNSIEEPLGTIPTVPKANLVSTEYLICPTIAIDYEEVVKTNFIDQQYGQSKPISPDGPLGSLTTKDKNSLVTTDHFIVPQNYSNGPVSVDEPMQTITANRKHHFLVNPQWGETSKSVVSSTDKPMFTLVARMDKTPPYLVTTETGHMAIEIYPDDPQIVSEIKEFMAAHGIIDIKMRMLRIPELKRIQGFPAEYYLHGTQEDQKKFIGNSVHPRVPKRWYEAAARFLRDILNAA